MLDCAMKACGKMGSEIFEPQLKKLAEKAQEDSYGARPEERQALLTLYEIATPEALDFLKNT